MSPKRELRISWKLMSDLRINERNPRKHSLAQRRKIERSIRRFGLVNPILVAENFVIIAGHSRLDFDVTLTGFDTAEIDILSPATSLRPEDSFDEPDPKILIVSRLEDVWNCGLHRITCGDGLLRRSYDRVMPGEQAQMVFADPPYNVPIQGHVTCSRRHDSAKFAGVVLRFFAAPLRFFAAPSTTWQLQGETAIVELAPWPVPHSVVG